jgi:hypothetical protein
MKLEDDFDIWGTYEFVDGVYNVKGHVSLIKRVEKLPFKFGNVSGTFSCYSNNLTSLKGAPRRVYGDFYCSYNNLTSLEGCPTSVGGDFLCSRNKLTSLEGAPKSIVGAFLCDEELKSTKEYRQYLIMKKLRD